MQLPYSDRSCIRSSLMRKGGATQPLPLIRARINSGICAILEYRQDAESAPREDKAGGLSNGIEAMQHDLRRLSILAALSAVVFFALTSSYAEPMARTQQQTAPADSCVVAPRPNSLWSLARCCASDLHSNSGCRAYDASDHYIIIKDNNPQKPAAYLIIPSSRVTGIDDPQIFSPPVLDFWDYGWQQAHIFLRKPAAEIALAINSAPGRTQNQLHIHIACVLPAVASTLAADTVNIGSNPASPLSIPLAPADHIYRVIKTAGLAGAISPFNLVAAMPGARADMADQSIAVIGSTRPGMFYVLATAAQDDNPGSAEELLDQTCGD